jgi:hypothetical protein
MHSRSGTFIDALRENAKAMTTMHDQMMHEDTTTSAPENGRARGQNAVDAARKTEDDRSGNDALPR